MRQGLLIILLLLTFGGYHSGFSQTPQETYESKKLKSGFSDEQWEKASGSLDYGQTKWVEEEVAQPKAPMKLPGYVKGFLFVIVIALLGFLVYRLVKGNVLFGNKTVQVSETVTVEDIEEDIHESDLERMLRQALSQNAFRLATRIYYLILLRELSIRDHITWKKDKPNYFYVREMAKHKLSQTFRDLTRIFEKVWYGNFEIPQGEFSSVKKMFEETIASAKA